MFDIESGHTIVSGIKTTKKKSLKICFIIASFRNPNIQPYHSLNYQNIFSIIEFALIRFLMHQICWIFFSFFPSLINLGEFFRRNRSLPTVAGFGIVESFTFVRSVCFFFDLNPLHSNCLRPIARLDA